MREIRVKLTMKDVNRSVIPSPMRIVLGPTTIVLSPGTHQPNQRIPATRTGPPTMAEYRRSSVGGNPVPLLHKTRE